MADTIREQTILAILSRMGEIRTDNGYETEIGANTLRVRKNLDPNELPASVLWPGMEEAEKQYGEVICKMPVRLEGFQLFGSTNPSIISEKMLGDFIVAMTGQRKIGSITAFADAGGGKVRVTSADHELSDGMEVIITQTTNYNGTFTISNVADDTWEITDTWVEDDATGLWRCENAALAITLATAGLAEDIEYESGGTEEYPEGGELAVGVNAVFNVRYRTLQGDPFTQP